MDRGLTAVQWKGGMMSMCSIPGVSHPSTQAAGQQVTLQPTLLITAVFTLIPCCHRQIKSTRTHLLC